MGLLIAVLAAGEESPMEDGVNTEGRAGERQESERVLMPPCEILRPAASSVSPSPAFPDM